jgi:hypothetical protein
MGSIEQRLHISSEISQLGNERVRNLEDVALLSNKERRSIRNEKHDRKHGREEIEYVYPSDVDFYDPEFPMGSAQVSASPSFKQLIGDDGPSREELLQMAIEEQRALEKNLGDDDDDDDVDDDEDDGSEMVPEILPSKFSKAFAPDQKVSETERMKLSDNGHPQDPSLVRSKYSSPERELDAVRSGDSVISEVVHRFLLKYDDHWVNENAWYDIARRSGYTNTLPKALWAAQHSRYGRKGSSKGRPWGHYFPYFQVLGRGSSKRIRLSPEFLNE